MWSWWRGLRGSRLSLVALSLQARFAYPPPGEGKNGAPPRSPPPPILPDLFPDQAGNARLFLGHGDDGPIGREAGDFEQELGADCFLELLAILDRHHEGTWSPDHAILVVPVEVLDIHGRKRRLLHHDRQAVDGDPLGERRFAGRENGGAIIVGTVAGNIDDLPQAAIRIGLEQR